MPTFSINAIGRFWRYNVYSPVYPSVHLCFHPFIPFIGPSNNHPFSLSIHTINTHNSSPCQKMLLSPPPPVFSAQSHHTTVCLCACNHSITTVPFFPSSLSPPVHLFTCWRSIAANPVGSFSSHVLWPQLWPAPLRALWASVARRQGAQWRWGGWGDAAAPKRLWCLALVQSESSCRAITQPTGQIQQQHGKMLNHKKKEKKRFAANDTSDSLVRILNIWIINT